MNDIKIEEIKWREKLVSIDRQLAEHDRIRQEIKYEPWKLALLGISSGIGVTVLLLTCLKLLGILAV